MWFIPNPVDRRLGFRRVPHFEIHDCQDSRFRPGPTRYIWLNSKITFLQFWINGSYDYAITGPNILIHLNF